VTFLKDVKVESKRRCAGKNAGKRGVVLLALVLALVLLGVGLAVAVPRAKSDVQRAKESELRFVLGEFRRAMTRFTERNGRPPLSIEEMIRDSNGIRFLRRIYSDPIAGKAEWDFRGTEIRSKSSTRSMAGVPYFEFR